jgi:hypothetical protein
MNTQDALGLLARHFLTMGAGYLVAKGQLDPGAAETLIGAATTILAVAWSAVQKKKSKRR